MSDTDAFVLADIAAYAASHSLPTDELQQALIAETRQLGGVSRMQIGTLQGAFMSVLTAALAPKFAVEVGTFTGYSSLAVARYLPPDARMLCCDISAEWTAIAQRYWAQAGVQDQIELRLAPAMDTLGDLADYPPVDLAFIDADKTNYINYYEALMGRLSPRGVVLVDNVLWSGAVLDGAEPRGAGRNGAGRGTGGDDTQALRSFNEHVKADGRVSSVMLPIGDGLTMITHAPVK